MLSDYKNNLPVWQWRFIPTHLCTIL